MRFEIKPELSQHSHGWYVYVDNECQTYCQTMFGAKLWCRRYAKRVKKYSHRATIVYEVE